jgi:hypothetical protein
MKTIILGHNADGEIRYIETLAANGVRGTGITADKTKATIFDSWEDATIMLRALEKYGTWLYRWRVRDAVIKPCD